MTDMRDHLQEDNKAVMTGSSAGRRPSWALAAGLLVGALGSGPVQAADRPSVCDALVAESVDPAAVRAALRAAPDSVHHTCRVRRSALGEAGLTGLFVVTGLVLLPGARESAKYAHHTTLQLAILRGSAPAAKALAKAGADPVGRRDTDSALTLAVMLDIEAADTSWTSIVLSHWTEPLPSRALSAEALDQLFSSPELHKLLRAKGLPRHGRAEDGTTWLHRALIQDWPMPGSDDALLGEAIIEVQASKGELPRHEETIGPGARFYKETHPRLSFAAVMDRGLPVDLPDAKGRSALYYAAYTGNWVAYDRLLDAGARPQRAGMQPESILFALAAGGSPERFERTLRRLVRRGHVEVADLSGLAGSLAEPEPRGWCAEPEERRPWNETCALTDQARNSQQLVQLGVSPTDAWWKARVDRQAHTALQRAVDYGFTPPLRALKRAVRQEDWQTTRMLVPHATLSPAQARQLGRMAARRGAPRGVRKTIDGARARAEGRR